MIELRAPFPYFGDAMSYALDWVRAGALAIDDDGRIWRTAEWRRNAWIEVGKRRAENVGGKGYLRVTLFATGHGQLQVMAHRLVYEASVGAIPVGLEIDHIDRNKANNRPDNLEPVTNVENQRRAHASGERAKPWSIKKAQPSPNWRGRKMLTAADHALAQQMRTAGEPLKAIARCLGIGTTHAHRITSGE